MSNYNNRDHSTTKKKPIDVATDTLITLPTSIPLDIGERPRQIPPIGSFVRVNKLRDTFEKESRGSWSTEVFRVVGHKLRQSVPMLVLHDLVGEPILGSFYLEEVQSIAWNGAKEVSQVLKTRTHRGLKEYLVNYVGWPPKFLEWTENVPEAFNPLVPY